MLYLVYTENYFELLDDGTTLPIPPDTMQLTWKAIYKTNVRQKTNPTPIMQFYATVIINHRIANIFRVNKMCPILGSIGAGSEFSP